MTARIRHVRVPVFTDEHGVLVYYGAWRDIDAAIERRFKKAAVDAVHERTPHQAVYADGMAWSYYPAHEPIIGISGALSGLEALSVLAHEASHAMDYMAEYLGIDDVNGEFQAHGIGLIVKVAGKAIMRANATK